MSDESRDQRDLDFLLEFREFKGVVNTKLDRALNDIKDLKDGTSQKILNLENRVKVLESQSFTLKVVLGLGVILLGAFIWHLTGFSI